MDRETFDRYVMRTYARNPITLVKGRGCEVWDSDGKSYLDFVAGIAVCSLGHASPVLLDAVTKQLATLHHVSNLYYTEPQGALAKWLVEHSCADRAFFCNSGGEANEGAFKLTRKYAHTKLQIADPYIICANNSFHGRTLACVTATGQPKYQKYFDPLVPGFAHVPYNDFAALKSKVDELDAPTRRTAAIMLEPLQGEGGVTPADRTYLTQVRTLCSERGILLIFDEVQTGVGRTGTLWCYEQFGVEPDIFTAAKGLAGGIPIGALLAKEFCAVFEPGEHATTFGGNPLACATALAVCSTIGNPEFLSNVTARGDELRTALSKFASERSELFAGVRGMGLLNGLVLQDAATVDAPAIARAAAGEGLLLVPAGPKVLRFVPPLIVNSSEISEAVSRLRNACAKLKAA